MCASAVSESSSSPCHSRANSPIIVSGFSLCGSIAFASLNIPARARARLVQEPESVQVNEMHLADSRWPKDSRRGRRRRRQASQERETRESSKLDVTP